MPQLNNLINYLINKLSYYLMFLLLTQFALVRVYRLFNIFSENFIVLIGTIFKSADLP